MAVTTDNAADIKKEMGKYCCKPQCYDSLDAPRYKVFVGRVTAHIIYFAVKKCMDCEHT